MDTYCRKVQKVTNVTHVVGPCKIANSKTILKNHMPAPVTRKLPRANKCREQTSAGKRQRIQLYREKLQMVNQMASTYSCFMF